MDKETRKNFEKHVCRLVRMACDGDQDAGKSLACMALLAGDGGGGDGGGEEMPSNIVFLDAFRRAA